LSLDTHPLGRHGAREDAPEAGHQKYHPIAQRSKVTTGKLKSVLTAARERVSTEATPKSAVRRALSTPAALRRTYLKMLAPAHRLYRDRHVEKLLFKPTPARQTATPEGPDAGFIYDGPIPGQVLDWVINDLDITLRECAFVDVRAAHGRTLLYAAMHGFDRVIGYEYNAHSFEDAQLNISQFPRTFMKCRDVECRRGDQGDIVIPDQPLVIFFPNAGRERFLSLMLDHVSASYRLNPRRIFVIMENAPEIAVFGHEDIFYEAKMPIATRLKLKLFSPVDIRVYRSIA